MVTLEQQDRYRHLLSRKYLLKGVMGEVIEINNIVAFVKERGCGTAIYFNRFWSDIGFDHGLKEAEETMFGSFSFYGNRLMRPMVINGRKYVYKYYWKIELAKGSTPGYLRDALLWHFSNFEKDFWKKRKKPNLTSRKKPAWGWLRSISTTQERRMAALHQAEHGDEMVRPARRFKALPNSWDDYWAHNQKCWKRQRKVRKQWQRKP